MGPADLQMSSSQNFYNVPKLASDGSNWVTYKTWLENAIKARGLVRHLTGSITRPANPEAYEEDYTPSLREILERDTAEQKVAKFEQDEASNHTTTKDLWGAILKEYEQKLDIAKVDVRRQMMEAKCNEGGDVRVHLNFLLKSKEQLAGMRMKIEDEDFSVMIMSSLPPSYHNSLRAITSAAHVTEKPLSPVTLMQFILEVYDEDQSTAAGSSKRSKPSLGEALYTYARGDASKPGTKKGGRRIVCWNCNKCGHTKAECRGLGGGSASGGDSRGDAGGKASRGNASANAATHTKGFMAMIDAMALTALDSDNVVSSSMMTTYVDTGASHHISPYHDQFTDFIAMAPEPIRAANKHMFMALGHGTLEIALLNSNGTMSLILRDVFYELRIKDGESHLINPQGETIGQIPQSNGLYRFISQKKSHVEANVAVKGTLTLSLVELHRRLRHVAVDTVWELVKKGLIEGITLDEADTDAVVCKSCICAKIKRTPFPVERSLPRASRYADQKISTLHTDHGGEYLGGEFQQMLKANRTHHELTMHDSPQQNGCSECLNSTLVMRAVAMLLKARLSKFLWAEAINHCYFVGYDSQSKGYHIYWPKKRSIGVERNVVFMDRKWREEAVLLEGEQIAQDAQNRPHEPFLDKDGTKMAPSTSSAGSSPKISLKSSTKCLTNDEDETTVLNVLKDDSSSETSKTDTVSHHPDHMGISGPSDNVSNASDTALEPAGHPCHEIHLSAYVHCLQSGEGIASGLSGSIFPSILPLSGFAGMVEVQDDADGSVKWEDVSSSTIECALASQVTSGHEPQTVTDTHHRADWPKWEAAINSELVMIHKLET
ncbi:hypothetical protein EW146_g4715 [Bondarzewia mesenterica]|uniref:CCHC-type domain-containing protein n=1 Tax=Bondarzewia mesenterica TaxID=1095465 RepID=A0A4S4LVI8_9AGAM|nr:hypothetical protein EW146_g4715 [Bondarzewia mesenterica]